MQGFCAILTWLSATCSSKVSLKDDTYEGSQEGQPECVHLLYKGYQFMLVVTFRVGSQSMSISYKG